MAIEKVITPGEGLPSVTINEDENIVLDEDGNAEVTLQNEQELEEAEAMGLMEEEDFLKDEDDFNANLVEFLDDKQITEATNELWEGFETDKQSREEYDIITLIDSCVVWDASRGMGCGATKNGIRVSTLG